MIMKGTVWAALAILAVAAPGARAQRLGLEARVSLRVEERQLSTVVRTLREASGANIVVIGDAAEKKVSLDLDDVHWRQALDLAAEDAGCVVEVRVGDVLAVLEQTPVIIEADDEDITKVIRLIAAAGGANIVVGPEVQGTVTVRLRDVPWRYALDVTVKTLGYTVVEGERGILRVVDPLSLQAQMETRSFQLRYLRPESPYLPEMKSEFLAPLERQPSTAAITESFTVLKALSKALSSGGELDYIESQNVLIVRDTQQVLDRIETMLARLDVEPAQVFVDVKLVSTLNTDILNLGVDYGDSGPSISASGSQIPITLPFGLGGGDWEDLLIAHQSGNGPWVDPSMNFGPVVIPATEFGALSFTGVQATLRMLQRDTQSEVIHAPSLFAMDGREATIFVGETVRYAEAKTEQGQAGGASLTLIEAEDSPVDVGFQLLIVPHVVPGTNSIEMDVIPKETSLSGTGSSALAPPGFDVFTIGADGLMGTIALPRTRSSTIVTTMLLDSGQTAVIGGLTADSDVTTESRVPGLWKLPVLGKLFQHKSRDRQRRSLLVFITPTIVHSPEDTEALLQRELARRNRDLQEELRAMMPLPESEDAGEPSSWEDEAIEIETVPAEPEEGPAEGEEA